MFQGKFGYSHKVHEISEYNLLLHSKHNMFRHCLWTIPEYLFCCTIVVATDPCRQLAAHRANSLSDPFEIYPYYRLGNEHHCTCASFYCFEVIYAECPTFLAVAIAD